MRNHGWVIALALLLGLCGAPGQLEGQQFKRGDGNGDSVVDIADPIYVLSFLFTGGPPPPPPFPSVGPDPTPDSLNCF